jgi:hypothetical protein
MHTRQQKAPADAVEALLTDYIRPKLKAMPVVPRDVFRDERMHRIAPNRVLERNKAPLRAVFARYSNGGKGRHVNMDGWLALLTDANLFDEGAVGTHEARQLFLVSRMYTCSEDADYPAYTSLSFTDFLEALARLSDVRVLPSPMELSSCGWANIYQWCVRSLPSLLLPLQTA